MISYGVENGLHFYIPIEDIDNLDQGYCRSWVPGFKMLLHVPGEVPQMLRQFFPIPFNQELLISVKPKIIKTSELLRHYKPISRQCYFQEERYLRYFKVYTQSNCELECLSNFTLKMCGCVKFSMPGTANTPICGLGKVKCLKQAKMDLQKLEYKQIQNKTYAKVNHRATECDCLPACTSIDYEAEVTQGTFDLKKMLQASDVTVDFMDEQPGFRLVQVRIFFKEAQFLTSQRSELFGRTEFIASCGGLLGLFLGVSAISFVEIIYFSTARLFTNLKLRKRKRFELRRTQIRDVILNNDMSKQC